jgi:hypothetical protein
MGPRLRCCERPTAIPAVVARDEFLTGRSHMWHPPSALTMRRQRAVEGLHQDALISSRVQERLATPRARRGTGRRGSCQSASGSLRSDPPLSHQRTPVQVFEHRPGHFDQVPLYLMSCNACRGGLPAIVGRSGAYPARPSQPGTELVANTDVDKRGVPLAAEPVDALLGGIRPRSAVASR